MNLKEKSLYGENSMYFDEFIKFIRNSDNFEQFFNKFSTDDYNHYKQVIMNNTGRIYPKDFFNNSFADCSYPILFDKTTWIGFDYDNYSLQYDFHTSTYITKYKDVIYENVQDAVNAGAIQNPMLMVFDFNNSSQVFKAPVNIWHFIDDHIYDDWKRYIIRPNRIYITDFDGFRVYDFQLKTIFKLKDNEGRRNHTIPSDDEFIPYAFLVDDYDNDLIYVAKVDDINFKCDIHGYHFKGITKEQIYKYVEDGIISKIKLVK